LIALPAFGSAPGRTSLNSDMVTEKPRPIRIAILCSFNADLLKRPLAEAAQHAGLSLDLHFSGYGLWETEAINPNSALYQFAADVVIVFADAADLMPPLHPGSLLLNRNDARLAGAASWQRVQNSIGALIANLPETTTILVHNLAARRINTLGTLEDNAGYSAGVAIEVFNDQLRTFVETHSRIRVIDYAHFVMEHGREALFDDRLWHIGRMRLGRAGTAQLAKLYLRYLSALLLPRRKVLVLDLDNTLWGGVLGEDGIDGIAISHEGIGLAFREFQLAILALAQRGIVLAIASKNNPADAMEVLEHHPEMVLRRRDFACVEIHWNPKSESLPRIAQQLNLGLDSFVFWDDEPREREIVRTQHPTVFVPDVPADPSDYARALLDLECFDVLNLTAEDWQRGEMYRQEADRQQWLTAASPADLGEFYRSLNMVVSVAVPDTYAVPRFAQLTQRTNQFNFTTRRYSEGDIRSMLADPMRRLYTVSLKDRFGELGVVGAAIICQSADAWQLDTFLMSCRALGRGVEDAFLAMLVAEAEQSKTKLIGEFITTKKNAPALQFLQRIGATLRPIDDLRHTFELKPSLIHCPSWITLLEESSIQS
jgi:FkbH-like protein